MATTYGTTYKDILVNVVTGETRRFWFVTLDEQVPSSAKRYATEANAKRRAAIRNIAAGDGK